LVRAPEQAARRSSNIVMKKTVDAPLRLPLEMRTTHGPHELRLVGLRFRVTEIGV
jgi:hypothetical protein